MGHEDTGAPIQVMLVDDHASFRQALTFMFNREQDFTVSAEAGTLGEARQFLEGEHSPERLGAAVVDLALPDGNGADLIGDLRRFNPEATVVVLSATLSPENFARAVEAGASGVLDKLAGVKEIIATLRRYDAGAALPSQREVIELLRLYCRREGETKEAPSEADTLTPLEVEVLQALAEGLNSETIAGKLEITSEHEETCVAGILDRLGASSRFQALAIAACRRLLEIPQVAHRAAE